MSRETIYTALGRIALGYVFLFLNINLGTINILPDWVAFLCFYSAIGLLSEPRDLTLLRPFCVLLGVWEGAQWVWAIFGGTLSLYPLNLVTTVVSLYFHFQLLTDLALLAEGEPNAADLAFPLRRIRTAQAVILTAVFLWGEWATVGNHGAVVIVILFANVVLLMCLLRRILNLRSRFRIAAEPYCAAALTHRPLDIFTRSCIIDNACVKTGNTGEWEWSRWTA